jgi:hypothetical protein
VPARLPRLAAGFACRDTELERLVRLPATGPQTAPSDGEQLRGGDLNAQAALPLATSLPARRRVLVVLENATDADEVRALLDVLCSEPAAEDRTDG